MAQVHLHIASFNAGELSPLLGARFAVEKVASGCRLLRNFLLHVHGPAFRRPGMEWMGTNAGSGAKSRLIGFNFSTTTGAILEFHPSGMRVWSNGLLVPLRTLVELPYSEAECGELQLVQVNDVCYIAHENHAPRKLIRYADDDWRISEIAWKWPALGDENVRNDEIATPDTTVLLSVLTHEWPDWRVPIGDVVFSVVNPNLSTAEKVAKWQRYDDGLWVTLKTRTWTTTAPAPWITSVDVAYIIRQHYSGPITAAGGQLRMDWGGSGGSEEDGSGSAITALDEVRPMHEKTVEVPAGEWQVTVTSPAFIPPDTSLTLEKLVGMAWVPVHELNLKQNKTTFFRGPTLTAPKTYRLNWRGREMDGTAVIERLVFPVREEITISVSATEGDGRTMTASKAIFLPEHVGAYWQLVHRRADSEVEIVSTEPTMAADTSSALRVSGQWKVFSYGTWATTLYLEKKISGQWETLRSWKSNKDSNVITDGIEEGEVQLRLRISAGTSDDASGAAVPRFVLQAIDAAVYGLVKIVAIGPLDAMGKSTTATVDVVAPLHSTAATALWTEGSWSAARGQPRAVALHGGRLWFGGTRAEPTRLWGSVVNDYENLRRSSLDDASVSFTPAAQDANAIQWMLSHENELILGTAGDEWTISADNGPITPTNVMMQRRSAYGSARVPALLVNEAVIFVQRGGRKLRQIVPRSDTTAWSAADMTVLAEHVARPGVIRTAAMTNPFTILWAVTNDGELLGMTFEQEQNVFGWHVHTTDGLVESVAVARGVESDEVWLCVNRDGARSIERLDPQVFLRTFESPEQLIYVDAGLRFTYGVPVDTISGLEHLEGREVAIMGDGAEQATRTVVNGSISLEVPVSTAVVGLPYESLLQPMRMEIPMRDGTAQHRQIRASRVGLFLHESLGGEIAASPDGKFERINYRRAAHLTDEPPPLHSGEVETAVESNARSGVDVTIRQTSPLPLNIGFITVKCDVFGE